MSRLASAPGNHNRFNRCPGGLLPFSPLAGVLGFYRAPSELFCVSHRVDATMLFLYRRNRTWKKYDEGRPRASDCTSELCTAGTHTDLAGATVPVGFGSPLLNNSSCEIGKANPGTGGFADNAANGQGVTAYLMSISLVSSDNGTSYRKEVEPVGLLISASCHSLFHRFTGGH